MAYSQATESVDPMNISVETEDVKCFGENSGIIRVKVEGGMLPITYTWAHYSDDEVTSEFTNLECGVYYLTVSDYLGNNRTEEIIIGEPSQLNGLVLTQNPSCDGGKDGYIEIKINGGIAPYSYFLNGIPLESSVVDEVYEGIHTVSVKDMNSCIFAETVTLRDVPIQCLRIPDVFTPNQDGVNDFWTIENIEMLDTYKLLVYNRWGQLIHQGNFNNYPWDGRTDDDQLLPAGNYLYVLEAPLLDQPLSGTVTIIY